MEDLEVDKEKRKKEHKKKEGQGMKDRKKL